MKNNQKKSQKQSIREVIELDDLKQDSKQGTKQVSIQEKQPKKEIGGTKGLEPTRYGDWEKNGRCIDF